jgi:hypothetical protein
MPRWILTAILSCLFVPGFSADTKPKDVAPKPLVAENGDRRNADNDGDGRAEPVHVKGHYRKDGTYVRGHYRAKAGK